MKDLGIVICNFNKVDYLKGCLETLYKSNFENLSYDVIVVDNASTDESVQFVKDNYKEVILLENEINTGGSGGFDRGIRYSIKKEYEYVALLDNDILLEERTILNLINYIKSNSNVGVVGSKICTMDNPEVLQEMGSFIDFEENFNIKTPLKAHLDNDELPDVVVCDYVPACCLITTNEVLKKVGSFNTDHFIYWDDMDWCTRVKRAGYEVHAINDSRVFHKMGVSSHSSTFGTYYFQRNKIMFYLKYLKEEKVNLFINSVSDWLLSVIFFSNLKQDYATPISLLLSLDDLLLHKLSAQDESILLKREKFTVFEKYNLQKKSKVALFASKDIHVNRQVLSHLQEYYENNIEIISQEDTLELLRDNFSQKVTPYNKLNTKNYTTIFYAMDHILNFDASIHEADNIIYIDSFLNNSSLADIGAILTSYNGYKNIFNNILKPALEHKLSLIRKHFTEIA